MLDSSDHYSFRLSSDESLKGTLSSAASSIGRRPLSNLSSSSKLKIDQMFQESKGLPNTPPKVHQIKLKFQTQKDSNNTSIQINRGIPDRDTPFSEARSAVQKQIQKMFDSSSNQVIGSHVLLGKGQDVTAGNGRIIKHTSHGVSHDFPSVESSVNHPPPPPVHYGVSDALKSKRSLSIRSGSVDSIHDPEISSSLLQPISDIERISPKHRLSSPNLSLGESSLSVPEKKKEYIKYKVDYLGALPVTSKSTSLSSLQRPLKDLYFKYRAMRNLGQTNLPGTLEINENGLVVQYIRELHKGVQEIFNSFSTIAVWAAVRFLHKRDVVRGSGRIRHTYAFLPLISDPDGKDKASLFNDIEEQEVELASDAPHPPLFACVMRRNGAPKQLECHGFVCSESEDAIVIAANLYQALLKTMKKRNVTQEKGSTKKLSPSITSTSLTQKEQPSTAPPTRPPRRRKRDSKRSPVRNNGSIRRSMKRGTKGRRSTKLSHRSSFDRRSSRRKKAPMIPSKTSLTGKGDVYTRVAIPRSKSFMNVTSQYNLQELFRELKEKEGVESIDDVLKKILSPDGISFNEIKPVYRELLLKLAMTMTQDEIFQRSKNIISQKKSGKSHRNSSSNSSSSSGIHKNEGILGSLFHKKSKSNDESSSNTSTVHNQKVITKADISNPIPISGKYSNSSTQTRPVKSAPLPPVPQSKVDDETYSCCGGCGTDYETVDYSDCSCISSPLLKTNSSSSSSCSLSSTIVTCNCDYGSCDSNDKCYCTLSRNSDAPLSQHSATSNIIIHRPLIHRPEKRKSSIGSGGSGYDSSSKNGYSSSCCCSCYYSSSGGSSISSQPVSSSIKKCISPNKVLMCSAVDTKGNIVYQGASTDNNNHSHRDPRDNTKHLLKEVRSGGGGGGGSGGEKVSVISMKKSAEIAAVFSGAKINQTTDIFSGVDDEDKDSTDDAYDSMRNGSPSFRQQQQRSQFTCHAHQFSEANLKHSLGYFP